MCVCVCKLIFTQILVWLIYDQIQLSTILVLIIPRLRLPVCVCVYVCVWGGCIIGIFKGLVPASMVVYLHINAVMESYGVNSGHLRCSISVFVDVEDQLLDLYHVTVYVHQFALDCNYFVAEARVAWTRVLVQSRREMYVLLTLFFYNDVAYMLVGCVSDNSCHVVKHPCVCFGGKAVDVDDKYGHCWHPSVVGWFLSHICEDHTRGSGCLHRQGY